ncbi:MAG: hypothetical protein ABI793_04310 [Flavobacterium sp.]
MKTDHNEPVTELLDLMSRIKYFTKLKPDNKNRNLFKTGLELKVSSYNELNLLVSDLLKVSIAVLKSNESGSSDSASVGGINVLILLEIALQLLPDAEIELLDELHKLHLKLEV